ncbi:hypothetical protein AB0K86_19085 [Streptomyces clavifer]|uniref:hypothetical protein n=1 Tax=Streptomyces TaxID=1883 RepID=UPI0006F39BA7|nr:MULTISPECIES: hypothetical protein [unclassified Streptomyces]KQX83863.1 hypothetical protein ASD26_02775 [Streptomyces sp. Root1319]KQZ04592.1 hypothetical protein ASD51_17435 [Streptomyces sp. Root55]MDX3062637.1 hypothetical protein [Streptomyces sp. ND04-05B]
MLRFLRRCFQGVGEAPGDPSVSLLSGNEFWEVTDAVVAVAVYPDAVSAAELEICGAMGEDWPGDPAAVHAV